MIELKVKLETRTIIGDEDWLRENGATDEQINLAKAEFEQIQQKQSVRQQITQTAGDIHSLHGTTSDAVHMLLVEFCAFMKVASSATDMSQINDVSLSVLATFQPLIDASDAGVKFPFQTKEQDSVMNEIIARAASVSDVLSE